MMDFKNIIYEKKEAVAKITINRSKFLNALNEETILELGSALEDARADSGVKVIILTGIGDKAFIAGADISAMKNYNPLDALSFVRLAKEKVLDAIRSMGKPVIAAVNGYALGGGCEVAMACDLTFAVETAMFGLPEINLGLVPGLGGMMFLPRLIGMKKAKELIFTGGLVTANQAERLGLINRAVPSGKLDAVVSEVVNKLLGKGSVALKVAKEAVNLGSEMSRDAALAYENVCFAFLFSTKDAKEGIRAFLEKRKPVFKGR